MSEQIKYEKLDKIALITFNRPDRLNAFTNDMFKQLKWIWQDFEHDETLRVAILTGTERSFSVGMDIKEPSPMVDILPVYPSIGVNISKPIISAVQGYCVGLGILLAFMSDIRIATPDAKFGYPEAKIGFTGGIGSLLVDVIPQGIALEMLLTGDSITAKRAYEIGLVNRVVPKEQLIDEAMNLADKIANNAPLVVNTLKKLARNTDIMKNAGIGNSLIGRLEASQDKVEGFKAFKEKRDPVFLGK